MKWEEIEYFFSLSRSKNILDIWCWNGRLLWAYQKYFWKSPEKYVWVDLSQWLISEAQKIYFQIDFRVGDMLNIWNIVNSESFNSVFLIASFHHLKNLEEREEMLKSIYKILETWWRVYMTNWALESSLNYQKYNSSRIGKSENKFGSTDFNIKFWKHLRYYHCFDLSELEYLAKNTWFKVTENRIFEWERNMITILEK